MGDFDEDLFPFAEAGQCRPRLCRMLNRGGSASWFDGKQTRVLSDTRAVQPVVRLPWPLSLFQLGFIEVLVYDCKETVNKRPISERTFRAHQSDQAIDAFLRVPR